jgi:Amt family ammonium transporter
MVWSGDGALMWDWGVLDFAGGTVVHINAGIAGLVACLVLGKRKGYPYTAMPPHNLGLTLIGASMLWVGWFGFNAGSAVAANGTAGMAMAVTQIATAAAALGWMCAEWAATASPRCSASPRVRSPAWWRSRRPAAPWARPARW